VKINFLVRWLPPRIDGVGDYTWNLACALREYGIDARIFTSEEQKGSKGLPENEWVFPVIKLWQPEQVIKALKTVIGEDSLDWLCFQYVPQMYGSWGICWQVADILLALKKEFRCGIAVTFHEFISGWSLKPKDLFLAAISRLQTRRILSAIDLAITTCSRYKDHLQGIPLSSLMVQTIPVGASVEPVNISLETFLEFRKKHFPVTAKILGLFSRLSTFRNFPLAVKVLQRARQEGLDAWLYLIGNVEPSNPKLFKDLMQFAERLGIKSYIAASGELSRDALSIHLKMVDVFIFPQVDGISTRNTALMAAMAHGLPIVSFKPQAGNFNNFYIPCAALADRNDEDGFIQAAVDCLKKSGNLSEAASANSDYYYKNFSWPIIAKRYLEALGV